MLGRGRRYRLAGTQWRERTTTTSTTATFSTPGVRWVSTAARASARNWQPIWMLRPTSTPTLLKTKISTGWWPATRAVAPRSSPRIQPNKTKLAATRSTSTLAAAVDTIPAPIESGADLNKEAPERCPLLYNPIFRRFRLTQEPKRLQTAAAPTRRPAPATPLTPQAPTLIEILESGAFACFQPAPNSNTLQEPRRDLSPVYGGTSTPGQLHQIETNPREAP